jgi:2-furoyl-CoA dehydrogenase FAD binding subunit
VLAAGDFQTGMLATARRASEAVTAVRFPARKPGAGYAFAEMAQRHGDFAICAVAAVVSGSSVRLGVGGVAEKPTVREWPSLIDGELDDALNDFAWDLGATDDHHASAAYRRELVRRLGRRVIEEAKRCAS